MWSKRFWRYAALLGSSVFLLQTTTGCPVDDPTLNAALTQAAVQLMQGVLSGQFCPDGATTTGLTTF